MIINCVGCETQTLRIAELLIQDLEKWPDKVFREVENAFTRNDARG